MSLWFGCVSLSFLRYKPFKIRRKFRFRIVLKNVCTDVDCMAEWLARLSAKIIFVIFMGVLIFSGLAEFDDFD